MEKFSEAIISIRPNFAEAILCGAKSVELRRRIPPIGVGTRLWIYATRPIGAVLGSAIVKQIVHGSPEEVWAICGKGANIDKVGFNTYFDGTDRAVGIYLTKINRGKPVEIEVLRAMRSGFHPPQVMLQITDKEAKSLLRMSRLRTIRT